MADIGVESVLSQLTTPEKVSLLAGKDFWHTVPIPRLGIPSLRTSDGPNGIRGTRFFQGEAAACLPCATALGSTFDKSLLRRVGNLLGQEARAKGVHILLGPTMNIQRSPLGGRGFESFSADPLLSGILGSEYCKGVQEEDILTAPKHYVCNDQEHERLAVNSIVTDRALREIYLMPFMLTVKNAKPATIMTSYNKVNGRHVSEHPDLMAVLRDDWRWEGLLMSDWFGTYSTSGAINAGLDLEMPGPTKWRGEALTHAVTSKKVKPHILNERVRAVLRTVKSAAKSGIPENAPEQGLNRPEDQEFLRHVAANAIVLLKNEANALPFDKTKSVAVIGPNAKTEVFSGGGSAALVPYYCVTPYQGICNQCKDVRFSQGNYNHSQLPLVGALLRTSDGRVGFDFEVFDKPLGDPNRKLLDKAHLTDSSMWLADYAIPDHTSMTYYCDCEGYFTPDEDGTYAFGLTVHGTGNLYIDDNLLVDNTQNQRPGTAFFGNATVEETASIDLVQGRTYKLTVRFGTAPTAPHSQTAIVAFGAGGLRIGMCKQLDIEQAIADAAKLAASVDQVIVFAGLNNEWESEGFDRPNMDLQPVNNELISKVLEANPKAVICVQSGTPVAMPWVDEAASVLQAWYGGNETGNAIADVVFGNVNPSGKLSLSFPHKIEDNPAFLNYRSEGGRTIYGEDVYVDYRFYEKLQKPALFPFGHGLSYTKFELSGLQISTSEPSISLQVAVANTGPRAGAEVVQAYVSALKPSINRPVKELKGFEKVYLEPGESKEVKVELEKKYALSFWDEERDAWNIEKGEYKILVGNSSQCQQFLEESLTIEETSWWSGL